VVSIIVEETAELKGSIAAPPSKSYSHRCIIAASLSKGKSLIASPLFCDDTYATIKACTALGVSIKQADNSLEVVGPSQLKAPRAAIDCGESGSTIRFLAAVAALAKGKTVLTGSPGLLGRPIGPIVEALQQLGVDCTSNDGFPPVTVFGGGIRGGSASLVGDVSSQFVTGLLLACPMAERDTEIKLTTPLESKPYVELTIDVIRRHGVKMQASKGLRRFTIPGGQQYSPGNHSVPGDYSSASFLLVAAAITGSRIRVENLQPDQPDIAIIDILERMGADINVSDGVVEVSGGSLRGVDIDARDIPDLVPPCTVLACFSSGTTRILHAGRLRIKESDRLATLPSELRKMGAKIIEGEEGLTIRGPCELKGGRVSSSNDHRIAMACAVAALKARDKTEILGVECVDKSYPSFFEDLKKLGGDVHS